LALALVLALGMAWHLRVGQKMGLGEVRSSHSSGNSHFEDQHYTEDNGYSWEYHCLHLPDLNQMEFHSCYKIGHLQYLFRMNYKRPY
jgi:hypothetical protein